MTLAAVSSARSISARLIVVVREHLAAARRGLIARLRGSLGLEHPLERAGVGAEVAYHVAGVGRVT